MWRNFQKHPETKREINGNHHDFLLESDGEVGLAQLHSPGQILHVQILTAPAVGHFLEFWNSFCSN